VAIKPANLATGPLVILDGPAPDDPLWWLSFADPDLPEGSQFLGVIITQAATLEDAVTRTHLLGINPGGGIQIAGPLPSRFFAEQWRDRLLPKDEAESIPEPEELGGE
jgi:hypothetical protein